MKRATVYFDDEIHKALRVKALHADKSISELVNDSVRSSLAEDLEDLDDVKTRRHEGTIPYEEFLAGLKRRGQI